MKPKFHLLTFLASLNMLLMPPVVAEEAKEGSTTPEPEKFALMVGINEYTLSPLSGCESDTEQMKKMLIEEFGFKDDGKHIKVLLSKQATKDAMVKAFREHLIENAKKNPNAIFVFQYSGHGSQVPDLDGDEPDGLDETLCPVDVAGDGKKDLTDDEMEALVKEMTDSTQNLTMIMDCCHSGSNTRNQGFTARRLDRPDLLKEAKNNSRGKGDRDDGKPMLPPNKRYVAIVGCMPNELSLETSIAGKPHGLLTYNLINALRNGSKDLTYRELWSRVASAVNKFASSQNPQIEGDLDRQFLKGAGNRSDSYFNVKNVKKEEDGKVTVDIDAGSLLGVEKGGLIAFYKKEATKLSGNENLITIGDVTEPDKFSSTVALRDVPADDVVLEDAKVISVTPFFGKRKTKVFLDSKESGNLESLISTLKSEISKKDSFELDTKTARSTEGGIRDWDVAIVAGKGSDFLKYGGKVNSSLEPVISSKEGFYIATQEGSPLFNLFVSADSPKATEEILEALEKKGRQESLRSFSNNASELTEAIDISIDRVVGETKRPGRQSIYDYKTLDMDNLSIPTFKNGERFRLSIQNASKNRLYVTGICIGADGSIQIAFPSPGAQDSVEPGAAFKTKPLKVGGSGGMETLKLIVTSQPVDFRTLEQPPSSIQKYIEAAKKGKGGVKDMLLMSMFKPETSRPLTSEVESLSDWTAKRIDYRVKD